jgi:hypothetical protein
MKKLFILFFTFLAALAFSSFQGCKKDDSTPVTPPAASSSIGQFTITPSDIVAGTPTIVTVRLTVPANVKLKDSTVKLIKVDADNKPISDVGYLYDNGKLANGDEIIGDNIFSGIDTINESSAGTVRFRVTGTTTSGGAAASDPLSITIYANLSSTDFKNVFNTQNQSVTKFNQYLGGNVAKAAAAVDSLSNWLASQTSVQSVEKSGTTSIMINYKSGLKGGVIISQLTAGGTAKTRGGFVPGDRNKTPKIPLRFQTVGTKDNLPAVFQKFEKKSGIDPKIIGNRNVLIYAPYEAAFAPFNERTKIETILANSGFEFDVTSLVNQAADVKSLTNMTGYGLVVLATHGSNGEAFATGEIVDTNAADYATFYKPLLTSQKLAVWTNLVISSTGGVTKRADIYAIRYTYLNNLAGTFPNSVILNNSCESTKKPELGNAFLNKGAKTYYGYNKVVNSDFCVTIADTVVRRLAKDLKNTGESYYNVSDPGSPFAQFQISGQNDVYYTDSLINGDFEFGKLDGWTKSGDGRVISSLGSVGPTQPNYMGIISTGLGFTTATGKIFQSFKVENNQSTLQVKWNFLSEEFCEYIGSQYQDYFKVIVKRQNGSETALLSKTIDEIAADFGASYDKTTTPPTEIPGNLVKVSPAIVFDHGGVYMTNWKTSSFDITPYRGQVVTLILTAGDVGDSAYDTAILLDEIKVQ